MTMTTPGGTAVTELRLSPTERRMMKVLEDGQPHYWKELHACLNDDLGAKSNIAAHLTSLRRKLRPIGQGVLVARDGREAYYQLIRFVRKE